MVRLLRCVVLDVARNVLYTQSRLLCKWVRLNAVWRGKFNFDYFEINSITSFANREEEEEEELVCIKRSSELMDVNVNTEFQGGD